MSDSLTFRAIRKDALSTAPGAVQKFAEDFCTEKEIFGIPCMVVISSSEGKSPYHFMEDEDYEEGLSEEEIKDCGVFSWFNNHPEAVFEYRWS